MFAMKNPTLFYFNPTVEMAVANGSPSYQPPLILQTFEREIAPIMQFMATADDIIVYENSHRMISPDFTSLLGQTPRFMTFAELCNNTDALNQLAPWGWSPAVYHRFKPIWQRFSSDFQLSKNGSWNPFHATLLNRNTSANILQDILNNAEISGLIHNDSTPVYCTTLEQIEKIFKMRGQIVLKAPLSSSGRGLQVLRKNMLNNSNRAWISSVLHHQGGIMVEPLFDKVVDVSFHFHIQQSVAEYLGSVYFKTNSNGGFQGCYLNVPAEHNASVQTMMQTISNTISHLSNSIEKTFGTHYNGFIGVDAMLIMHNNTLLLHPCLEINMRTTMGLITLKMREKMFGVNGFWEIVHAPSGIDLAKYKHLVSLTPVDDNNKFGAFLRIEK
jgi:hypothetical protein